MKVDSFTRAEIATFGTQPAWLLSKYMTRGAPLDLYARTQGFQIYCLCLCFMLVDDSLNAIEAHSQIF